MKVQIVTDPVTNVLHVLEFDRPARFSDGTPVVYDERLAVQMVEKSFNEFVRATASQNELRGIYKKKCHAAEMLKCKEERLQREADKAFRRAVRQRLKKIRYSFYERLNNGEFTVQDFFLGAAGTSDRMMDEAQIILNRYLNSYVLKNTLGNTPEAIAKREARQARKSMVSGA